MQHLQLGLELIRALLLLQDSFAQQRILRFGLDLATVSTTGLVKQAVRTLV